MNKFFAGIFAFFLSLLLVCFFVVLNTKILATNPDSIKKIIEKSRLSDIVAFYIKDDVVKKSGISLDEGTNFEELHETVSEDAVRVMLFDAVDELNIAINNPTQENLSISLSLQNEAKPNLSFHKTIELEDNPFFWLLAKANLFLILIFALIVVCSLGVYLLPKNNGTKLSYAGWSLIAAAIILASIYSFMNFSSLNYEVLVERSNFVREAKLINGTKRVVEIFIANQMTIYYLESVLLLALGLIIKYLSNMFHKEKLDHMTGKI